MKFQSLIAIMALFLASSCATSRDMTSSHYLPEWENKFITLPSPSETSGGRWVAVGAQKVSDVTQSVFFFPFAVIGNILVNAYYIPTWPLRTAFRGDNRMIVWHPLFGWGQKVESDFFSSEWNRDLV